MFESFFQTHASFDRAAFLQFFEKTKSELSQNQMKAVADLYAGYSSKENNYIAQKRNKASSALLSSHTKAFDPEPDSALTVFTFPKNLVIGQKAIQNLEGTQEFIAASFLSDEQKPLWQVYMSGNFTQVLPFISELTGYEPVNQRIEAVRQLDLASVDYCMKQAQKRLTQPAVDARMIPLARKTLSEAFVKFTDEQADELKVFVDGKIADSSLAEVICFLCELWNEATVAKAQTGLQLYIDARAGKFDHVYVDDRTKDADLCNESDAKSHKELWSCVSFYLVRAARDGDPFWVLYVNGFFDKLPQEDLHFMLAIIGRESDSADEFWGELEQRTFTRCAKLYK
jgi:hypothetical protein